MITTQNITANSIVHFTAEEAHTALWNLHNSTMRSLDAEYIRLEELYRDQIDFTTGQSSSTERAESVVGA